MDEVEITADDVRRARRAYYGNISYVDEWTARLTSRARRGWAWPTTPSSSSWPTTATCSASAGSGTR